MITRMFIVLATAATSADADLYAAAATYEQRSYYRLSTGDGSAVLLSTEENEWGLDEMTLGTDGNVYGSAFWFIDRIDPVAGTSEFVHQVPGNCFAYGALCAVDGLLYYGIDFFCPSALVGLNTDTDALGPWHYLPDCFIAHVAAVRDDGLLLTMDALHNVETVYSANPFGVIGTLEKGTVVESFARDPVSGTTFMLGQAPGDGWSLYEIDLYTLKLTRIGAVQRDIKAIAGMPPCAADFNQDGSLDILDFVAFQLAFQAGDADVNGDGVLDLLDFVAFQSLFLEGCP